MKYEITKDKIIVKDKIDFSAKHILECGQIFRYKKTSDSEYEVFSDKYKAVVTENADGYEICSSNIDYFENFFDLSNDYSQIKKKLSSQNQTLKDAIEFASGIRILNQPPLEMIVSFILSANNNIKRIQLLVDRLCTKCGTNMGDYYAFPTLSQLLSLSVEDLRSLGMGFRAEYIYNTSRALEKVDLETLRDMPSIERLNFLTSLSGVGPKVADCISLFAYHDMNCFPVDTWVEKIYNSYFANGKPEKDRNIIRNNLTDMFLDLSGYAQQYLFYYKRELDKK